MLRAFTVVLLESFKSWLLFLVALLGLIDTLEQLLDRRFLLRLSMTLQRRYLAHSNFLSTTSLALSLALHLLFCSVRRSLYGGRKQTHTNRGNKFNVKDKTHFKEKHDLLQRAVSAADNCRQLPTTALKIMLGRLPDVQLKVLSIIMVEINTSIQ